jgi:phage N-6-adenine-methyltransferase
MTDTTESPNDLARKEGGSDVVQYDPERGLQTVAVSEAGEKHWTRAKDSKKLFDAIAAKIKAQAEYVCWRDDVEKKHHAGPGRGNKNPVAVERRGLPAADPGDDVIHRWRKSFCFKGETGTIIDKDKMALALDDAQARALRVVEQQPKGTERGTAGTGEFLRYTPAAYVEASRAVLGTIDLDPASDAQAQQTVKAEQFFTAEDDGLERMWLGNVFLNPPYSRELCPAFVDKLVAELAAGRVKQAIMLTNNSTDTAWFRIAAEASTAICFTTGRVGFTTPTGDVVAPTQGQAFFYFGNDTPKFQEVFGALGFAAAVLR